MENVLTHITVQFENENGKQWSYVMRISLNRYIAKDSMQNKVQKNIAWLCSQHNGPLRGVSHLNCCISKLCACDLHSASVYSPCLIAHVLVRLLHQVEHLVLVRMPWKRLRRARGLVHYPLAGQRKSRDASRDSRAGPRIVVITSRPDTIDNDHWYSNSWETENAMNQSTWSGSQPCQGCERSWPMRGGAGQRRVGRSERANQKRRTLNTNWDVHSMWSHFGVS